MTTSPSETRPSRRRSEAAFFIETKTLRGKQRISQQAFQAVCDHYGVGYYLCRSPARAVEIATERGLIDASDPPAAVDCANLLEADIQNLVANVFIRLGCMVMRINSGGAHGANGQYFSFYNVLGTRVSSGAGDLLIIPNKLVF